MTIDIEKLLEEKSVIINKTIEKFIPRKYDLNSMIFTLGPPTYRYNEEAVTKAISEPVWEFLDRGGKRWRPVLFLLVSEALGVDSEKYLDMVLFPELIHNGTIIADDIEDMSKERRGKPALHLMFGEDIALNASNALYFLALLPLLKNKEKFDQKTLLRIYEVYAKEMTRVSFGQATDIAWHKGLANSDNISEEEYLEMCSNKTGCIARLAAKTAAIIAGRDDREVNKIGKFTETIGIAFQIQDDILNLVEGGLSTGKGGVGEDITEGKRSLLVIYTLQKSNEKDRKRLLDILKMHTFDQRLRDEAIAIMKKYDAIGYAKEKAMEMVKDSWEEIDKILPESDAKEKLKAFAYYLIERKI